MEKFDFTIENRKYTDCFFRIGRYDTGGIAVQLMGDCGEGWPEPIDTLTYNLGKISDDANVAVVKDNSFSRGVVTQLNKMGIIRTIVGFTSSGYYDCLPVCEFDLAAMEKYLQKG